MSHLESILENLDGVPPFSEVAQRAMALIENPNVSAKELGEVIQYDLALTANVLKTCNSPYYGIRKVASVHEAVVVIGHNTLKDIIVTCTTAEYFRGEAGVGYGHDQGDLWKHCVATAIMAKLLTGKISSVDSGTAFTTALMHDVGKLVLSNYVSTEFREIVRKVQQEQYSFSEAEQEILGITHAEIGAKVLTKWAFPESMITAVKCHHDPDVLMKEPLSAVVALSNVLVVTAGIGGGIGGLATKIKGEGLKRFGIGKEDLDHLLVALITEFNQAQEIVNL